MGGGVSSSYKIANALRKNFKEITVFIPHIAASGGTLIALTGNKIIMGEMSHLTPIDVQVSRGEDAYSVNAMIRSFQNLRELLKKCHEDDVEYPIKALVDKLDPVELQEWIDKSELMEQHAQTIMKHQSSSLKDKAQKIIEWLAHGCSTHSYSITFEEAQNKIGSDIVLHCTNKPYDRLWSGIQAWLRKYLLKESGYHIVRYILPPKDINNRKPILNTVSEVIE